MSSVFFVPGEGDVESPLVFVGEAPGAKEDELGRPFVGRSGVILDKMIEYLGVSRSKCYITNAVKVRPDNNRTPTESEIASWRPLLISELGGKPRVIVALGLSAAKALLGKEHAQSLNALRSSAWHHVPYLPDAQLVITYHPAYILRNPSAFEELKKDLDLIRTYMVMLKNRGKNEQLVSSNSKSFT